MIGETYYYKLTLASPVHIGTGEVYEPMGFVIDQETCELISFTPAAFLGRLTSDELEKFSSICQRGTVESIQDLYKFMRQHKEFAEGERIAVSASFVRHYKQVLDKPKFKFKNELNQFEIYRTAFNLIDNQPIIPGSSIKGAIRTAVLNSRLKENPQPVKDYSNVNPKFMNKEMARESSTIQRNLLGGTFATDPFRLVKVSDFVPVEKARRKVIYAVDRKKKRTEKEAPSPYQILEIVEEGTEFWGSITVLPAQGSIRKPITIDEISKALDSFYGAEKIREDRELTGISITPANLKEDKDTLPLRIGRHSGAECITVRGHRQIKISPPGIRPPKFSKNGATTIWVAAASSKPVNNSGLQSMGWTILTRLSDSDLAAVKLSRQQIQVEQSKQRQAEAKAQAEKQALLEEQARAAEEQRILKEKEAAARLAREEAEKKKWRSMSEGERDLAIIHGEEIANTQAPGIDPLQIIWPKIEKAGPEHQKALAAAFKKRWENESGKWQKKKCSKKQFKKVQRVKEILGLT